MKTQGFLLKYPEGKSEIGTNGNLPTKNLIVTTWQELKDKRDAGKLIPGALYRITDYNCTTTQENTQSAGHQFDIVLLALSENKLAEEGWAMMNESNIYDVTFADGVTKKCYLYSVYDYINVVDIATLLGVDVEDDEITINEETKTATTVYPSTETSIENYPYNYFQNSNLSAWKVWYCLDNDTARFAWADDSVDEDVEENIKINGGTTPYFRYIAGDMIYENTKLYAWKSLDDIIRYSKIEEVESGIFVYQFLVQGLDAAGKITSYTSYHKGTGSNGRGVIYRLIDEFNNDIKYDFKNIQFKRKLTDGQYDATNGTDTWCYTLNLWYEDMCQDASIVGNTLPNDEGFVNGVYDNKFGYATAYDYYIEGVNTFAFALGNNVVLSTLEGDYYGIYSNTIGNSFTNNTIGSAFTNNVIGSNFNSNTIGNYFGKNIIGTSFSANTIGHDFYSNTIGNDFMDNTIGNGVNYNMVGNSFTDKTISDNTSSKNYGNNGVELATKDDLN